MQLRGVIFDLDGVITDTAEYHYRAWQRLADEEGLPFDRQTNERLRGVSRRASLEIILNGRPMSEERIAEMMERKNGYYVEMLQQVSPQDLLPGAVPLLEELRAAGIKVALGSASKNAQTVIKSLGIAPLFDAIADGFTTSVPKPQPDLFLKAAEMLGLPPAFCAVVEDAAAGVDAALAGRMWAIGVGPEARVGHADLRFENLAGVTLKDILEGLERASWTVAEARFDSKGQHHMETVFTIGNGHFCVRGAFEEGYPGDRPACFMHGLWDDMPTNFTELANLPRWYGVDVWINGERFRMDRGRVVAYRRWLDLRTGTLQRLVHWQPAETPPRAGASSPVVELRFERLASLEQAELGIERVSVYVLSGEAELRLRTGLDMHVENTGLLHWNLVHQTLADDLATLHVQTRATHHDLALAASIRTEGAACTAATCEVDGQPAIERRAHLRSGETLILEKFVAMISGPHLVEQRAEEPKPAAVTAGFSQQHGQPAGTAQPNLEVGAANARLETDTRRGTATKDIDATPDLGRVAGEAALSAREQGYAALARASADLWAKTWETADVLIEGDHEAQLALRFNVFQLAIAAPRWSEHASIGAKTLSGFGYRHHIFWDTEVFMLPPFMYVAPELARNMLMYRWHNLPGAREKARGNGYDGAQFPWESAGDGREVTPTWLPHFADPTKLVRIWTGDIEIHITADIAHATMKYAKTTGDESWLAAFGAELVLDGAKFWASAAREEPDGKYHYRNVIGPDEYHDRIDDNAYTNYIARWHLQTALGLTSWLKGYPEQRDRLVKELDLSEARLAHWRDVIERMFLPVVTDKGVIEQFTGYFSLTDADFAELRSPARKESMQAILGIEECAETQILKQPDVLMYQYLFPEQFSAEQVRANYDYYSPRTDHEYGSSLGPSISAIMSCRVGDTEAAYEHFMRAARADLRDVRGNAGDGIHGASAGGLWQAAVFGFAGLEVREDGWESHPRLPAHWERLAFKFYHRGRLEEVDVKGGDAA